MEFPWWPWRRKAAPRRADLHFVVYSRVQCHLCDVAWQELERLRAEYGFSLEKVDVDSRADWLAAHGEWVPVVEINGKVRFRGRINRILLERILNARGSLENDASPQG